MEKHGMKFWVVIVFLALLSACRTTKQVTEGWGPEESTEAPWVEGVRKDRISEGVLTAKMNLSLWTGSKKITADGMFHLKRNELIQLSVSVLGFMELGRLEFTPDYVMVINRAGREYAKVMYHQVPYLKEAGIDFYTLQALFWNELFVPRKGFDWAGRDFVSSENGGHLLLSLKESGLLQCLFRLDGGDYRLRSTQVALARNITSPLFSCVYEHFTECDGASFPDQMRWELKEGATTYSLAFKLSAVKHNAKQVVPSATPGSRYKALDISSVLKQLVK